MATWRDQLRPASFRGVPFHVNTNTLTAGRRLARHEYPQRDVPYLEDLGRKAREYQVEAYIVGTDYMAARDALLDAIEAAGAGQLVHPRFGTVQVTVSECQLTESTQEGGIARFTLTFVEAGRQQEPDTQTDTAGVLAAQHDASEAAFTSDFARTFSTAGLPDFAVQDALANANAVLAMPGVSLGELSWIRADPTSSLNALLPENLLASMGNPQALAAGVLAMVRRATDLAGLLSFSVPSVTGTTPARTAQAANRAAFAGLVQQAATAQRIVNLASSAPDTLDDARIARAEIVTRADTVLLADATGQASADAILQLRTDAVAHFTRIQPSLPRLVSITPRAVRPAIVLAHDFYGADWFDAGREDEIVTRNRVRHPGFVPAGRALELVS